MSFQVAHFLTPFNYDGIESIHAALNGLLPPDIRVREVSPAVPEFHARFSAKSKIYHYKIYNDSVMDPFLHHYAYHSAYKLNTLAMREAAKHFIGKHDFSSFANASHNDRSPNPVKDVQRFDVNEMVNPSIWHPRDLVVSVLLSSFGLMANCLMNQGALLQLEVEGSGFLYRQVRNMVNHPILFVYFLFLTYALPCEKGFV